MTSRVAQLAVLAAATALLAPASALARAGLGPKTHVGVFSEVAELDVGAREAASLDEHLENFDDEWALAVEKSFHENGHRFYDPETGSYTSPEPILRNPYAHVAFAYFGHSLPTYSYAFNNPVGFKDLDGTIVIPVTPAARTSCATC